METLRDDPDLADWWAEQSKECLSTDLVRAKEAGGRRILGAIQATPGGSGFSFLYAVRPDATPEEEYRLAAEFYDRSYDLVVNGRQDALASKGVHAQVALDEAHFCALSTYTLAGQILASAESADTGS